MPVYKITTRITVETVEYVGANHEDEAYNNALEPGEELEAVFDEVDILSHSQRVEIFDKHGS